MRAFAIVGPDGTVSSYLTERLEEAIDKAGTIAENVHVESDPSSSADVGELAADPRRQPSDALRLSGLAPIRDFDREVMSLSLEEAYDELRPFFDPGIKAYSTPMGLAKTLLGQNYKTAKETPEKPSDVQGLNLLPHVLGARVAPEGALTKVGPLSTSKSTLCIGSSPECRAACLAHTGRNVYAYSMRVKRQRCEALLGRPKHFLRAIVARVEQHQKNSMKRGDEPFVRMNVLSDIPWELFAPGLFEHFPSMRFYDYTKVPGRRPPRNYDLTFSYSGRNWEFVRHEMEAHRRRVAIVFLPKRKYRASEIREQPMIGLPNRFQNRPVVEGDFSDVRPRDPQGVFVGLRWKIPRGAERREMKNSAFVVPVQEKDGYLIAGLAAKDQPIEDADERP